MAKGLSAGLLPVRAAPAAPGGLARTLYEPLPLEWRPAAATPNGPSRSPYDLLPLERRPDAAAGEAPPPSGPRQGALGPALGRIARAVDPVLDQAADLTEAAFAAPDPGSAPAVSNTFNVTVALSGDAGPTDREAVQDALVAILHDAARRQGLDL